MLSESLLEVSVCLLTIRVSSSENSVLVLCQSFRRAPGESLPMLIRTLWRNSPIGSRPSGAPFTSSGWWAPCRTLHPTNFCPELSF